MQIQPEPEVAQEWIEGVRQIVKQPRVFKYLDKLTQLTKTYLASLPEEERAKVGVNETKDKKTYLIELAEQLLPTQDKKMRDYAQSWLEASQVHVDAGLYRHVVEFFRPEEGLLVDLGCGVGRLLAEWPYESAIGVDINHYCLQATEKLLGESGRKARRFSKSYISFDPEKGLVLKPYPVMEEVDLSKTVLLLDDVETLHNTIRVLYNHGRKADAVAYILQGGHTNRSPINFIDVQACGNYDEFVKQRKQLDAMKMYHNVANNVGKICKSGGRFLFGIRYSVVDDEGRFVDTNSDQIGEEFARMHQNIDVVRTSQIPMESERGLGGIQMTTVLDQTSDGKKPSFDISKLDLRYNLYLFDARVK